MARIIFICRQGESYSSVYSYNITGLWNSANFVADAISNKHEVKVVKVADENGIDKELFNFKPDIVILEAVWVTPKKLNELVNISRYKNLKWIVRVHSKPTFLANEGIALTWLVQYAVVPNVVLSGNNNEFNSMMAGIGVNTVLLPNVYNIEFNTNYSYDIKDCVDIGCFGAIRPMKNHLQQASGAIEFANRISKKLRFHVNATRAEQGGENVLKNLRALFSTTHHELIEHPWYPHSEFLKLVAQMDMGLQVSLSESFNIVSADFVSQNIPIVTSKEVDFVASMYYADTGSIHSISKTLTYAYNTRVFRMHKVNQWLLNYHNSKALNMWNRFLGVV